MKVLDEFKNFAVKGNVVDMGVGIVIGAAFTSIVNSLVRDIINPVLGVITGGIDFSNFFVNLGPARYESLAEAQAAGAPTLNYGLFVNAVISFLIVAWILFFLIRATNRMRKRAEDAPASPATPEPAADVRLLTEIRDILARGTAGAPSGTADPESSRP